MDSKSTVKPLVIEPEQSASQSIWPEFDFKYSFYSIFLALQKNAKSFSDFLIWWLNLIEKKIF